MKKYFLNMVLASCMMLVGCNNHDNGSETPMDAARYITVSTNISSRVATADNGSQSFENGDCISVYAWTGSNASVPGIGNRVVDNALNTLSSGKWQSEPQMLWKNMEDEHFFIAVYPCNAQAPIANLEGDNFEVKADDQEESDLLVATNLVGTKAQSNPVPLDFDHVMAKVIVNLEYRNQWGTEGPKVTSVSLENVASKCQVNYLAKSVTPGTERSVFALPAVKPNKSYSSIVIPQAGVKEIKIEIDGKDYLYQHSADIELVGGKYTTINLMVGRNEVSIDKVVINDWQEGPTLNGGEALD